MMYYVRGSHRSEQQTIFLCSLCHNGILGGGLIVDDNTITFKTGKVTVNKKFIKVYN